MDKLQEHINDPDNLGIAMGNVTTDDSGRVYVILHHRKKPRQGRGLTLEAAVADCFPAPVVEIDLGDL